MPDKKQPAENRFIKGMGRFVVSLTWGVLLAVVLFVVYLVTHL